MANLSCEFNEIDWVVEAAEHPESVQYRRYCDWYEGKQTMDSMEDESRRVSTAFRQLGWSEQKTIKRVMSMPLHLFVLIRRIDPEFSQNTPEGKAKLYRFLARHKQFQVR